MAAPSYGGPPPDRQITSVQICGDLLLNAASGPLTDADIRTLSAHLYHA